MGANPGGGGGGDGGTCPPTFFQVGDTISNVPPPPRFWVGWILVDIMYVFACFLKLFFFFFLLVRNVRDVGWVPLHILTCATFDADGAPEKRCRSPPPPPPAHQLFWDLRYLWGWRRSGNMCLSPPPPPTTIRFGFAPLLCSVQKRFTLSIELT